MDLFRRFFSWLRGENNFTEPDRATTDGTAQASNEGAENSNPPPPLPERAFSESQAFQNLQMTILVDAFRAIVRAECRALEDRIVQDNNRVISDLHTDIENIRQDMRSYLSHPSSRQTRDQVFSANYVPEDQKTIPANSLQEAAGVQQSENESLVVLNEEVPNQQNENQALNVSDQQLVSAQALSQEVSRMPAEQNENRNNNNITVANCYKMDHKNRGLCVIFSHMLFKNKSLEQRTSAPKEAKMLENTFERKGFRVIKCEDFTISKIKKQLRQLESLVNDDDDCICICISTHGLKGILWALDYAYPITIFENTLVKIKRLTGKPKLMFIQACRGTKYDRGISLDQATSESEDQSDNEINSKRYPTRADFLIAHSTPCGYVSWRNWFFKALCKNLEWYGQRCDMDEILRKTAREICKNESHHSDKIKDRTKQIPVVYSTLTKRLFFKRK